MAAAITPDTRLIFVCTPNNPTGTAVRRDDLPVPGRGPGRCAGRDRRGLPGVRHDRRRPPTASSSRSTRPMCVALRTLSKAYGLAGLRVGYAVGDPQVITALRKVAIPFALNSLAQAAALAALACEDELAPRWQQVVAERDRVTAALRGLGYEVPDSQANFVWLPLRERAAEFAAHCEAHKVIVRAFPDAAGGVRVTIGTPGGERRVPRGGRHVPAVTGLRLRRAAARAR